MSYDEMELDTLGDRKTALFVIISDTDDTFNFVVAIMYSQLFNLLCDKADDVYNGRLPVHVRCLLDEFAKMAAVVNWLRQQFGVCVESIQVKRKVSGGNIGGKILPFQYRDNLMAKKHEAS